jgi:hypothetical protein
MEKKVFKFFITFYFKTLDGELHFEQLRQLFTINTIPFIGFGFLDNAIMVMAGEYIDQSLGALLCISTMAAAALGNVISGRVIFIFKIPNIPLTPPFPFSTLRQFFLRRKKKKKRMPYMKEERNAL